MTQCYPPPSLCYHSFGRLLPPPAVNIEAVFLWVICFKLNSIGEVVFFLFSHSNKVYQCIFQGFYTFPKPIYYKVLRKAVGNA